MRAKQPLVLGIAGGSGSGKTYLTQKLLSLLSGRYSISIIEVDYYYRNQDHLPLSERCLQNYDHPDSLELELLEQHLRTLKLGRPVSVPQYDYALHTRRPDLKAMNPSDLIVVEGILAMYTQELQKAYDLKIFVDTPAHLRLDRRIRRDVQERGRTKESVLQQWHTTVLPMHEQFCEPCKEWSDLTIKGEADEGRLIDLLKDRLK